MKTVLVIGSGIAGLSCAIECALREMKVILVSPFPSERAQSVLAAGGINAVTSNCDPLDSIDSHIEDTLKGGRFIAGKNAVKGLCEDAPAVIDRLKSLGTVFTTDDDGNVVHRAFGGQSHKRTCYCGSSTGKQIVTALTMEARRLEGKGLIRRRLWMDFHSALIKDGICYGALFYNEAGCDIEEIMADSIVVATGGQNALFGKTTGSTLCDGYVQGRLFMQGVDLKNLEFIQYHPTTLETSHKRMAVTEAVRGEGGRLYYEENGKRVYFMEDMFGEGGNLMPRDVVSRCMAGTGKDIFLDISFLGKEKILKKIPEVYELCMKYRGIDISKESIPVVPSIHFFMGGIAVNNSHETNIKNLYAIGECASIYHGANRLGGNSMLAAIHGAKVAADAIMSVKDKGEECDFAKEITKARKELTDLKSSESIFPVMYIRDMLAETMNANLGIIRDAENLEKGIEDVTYYLSVADRIRYDRSELAYFGYSLTGILTLAKAVLTCALYRKESRGAHYRCDHPKEEDSFLAATVISYDNGRFKTKLDKEGKYES